MRIMNRERMVMRREGVLTLLFLLTSSLLYSFPYQTGWPQAIEGGVYFSSPCIADVDNDDTLEILIAGNTRWVYLFDYKGEIMAGWPQRTSNNPNGAVETSSPAVADIDNDGKKEIVYASDTGQIFAWEIDGSTMAGFPVDIGDNVIRACVTLEDVDSDDTIDICIGTGFLQYKFFVYRYNGSLLFEKDVEYRVHSTAAVADVDYDGEMEIVHGVDRNVQFGVYAWESDGSSVMGWPVETGHHVDGSPAVADVDNDSTFEVFVGSIDNMVYGWDFSGQHLPSWPNRVGTGVYEGIVSSPAVGDIDKNDTLDIVIGRGIIQSSSGALFAFSMKGDTLPGFPVILGGGSVTSSPILAELDGDTEVEILVGCQDGLLYCFNHDGTIVDSFPLAVCSEITSSPAVGDLDCDGDIEIIVGGKGSSDDDSLYVWDIPVQYDSLNCPWPMFHHDEKHTGRYPLGGSTGVRESISESYSMISLYPTVTRGRIFIQSKSSRSMNVTICDISGRVMREENGILGSYIMDGIEAGIYFLRCSIEKDKTIKWFKVVVLKP
jgi:hypothetical protein